MDGQRSNHGERRPCSESDSSEDSDDRDSLSMGPEDTVYRYLCPVKNVGCIIGRDGETIKQLMLETKSKIIISQLPGREERVVTIYSGSEKTNDFEGTGDNICPAQEALIKVHDRLVAVDTAADNSRIIARLLVPSDQIGCVVGKGGQLVQSTCGEIVAHVLKISSDDASSVKKALYQVASMLHDTPSPSQHLFSSCLPTIYPRNEASLKTFLLRLVCPVAMTGRVLGKRGSVINQIRQDSGASINVGYEGDDCLITISAKEAFEDTFSPVIDAALRLQPKCSERVKGQHGIDSFSTNLLVFSSQVGCLIGNEGSVLSEIRKVTNADIRILPKQSLPRIASRCETMVQLRGDLEIAKAALIQVTSRLRDNLFGKEDADSAYTPVVPYLNMSGGYGSAPTPPPVDAHGDYGGLELSTYVYPYPHTTGGYGSDPPPPPGDAYGDYGGLELSTYVYPHPHTSGGYGFQLQAGGGSDDSYESSSSGSSDDSRLSEHEPPKPEDQMTAAIPEPEDHRTAAIPEPEDHRTAAIPEPEDHMTAAIPEPEDHRTAAIPEPEDQTTAAIPEPEDQTTAAIPEPEDQTTAAIPEPEDQTTAAIPEPEDQTTAAIPEPEDQTTAAIPEPEDQTTAAIPEPEDQTTAAIPEPEDQTTAAIPEPEDQTTAAIPEPEDHSTAAIPEPEDHMTAAIPEPEDNMTAAIPKPEDQTTQSSENSDGP